MSQAFWNPTGPEQPSGQLNPAGDQVRSQLRVCGRGCYEGKEDHASDADGKGEAIRFSLHGPTTRSTSLTRTPTRCAGQEPSLQGPTPSAKPATSPNPDTVYGCCGTISHIAR